MLVELLILNFIFFKSSDNGGHNLWLLHHDVSDWKESSSLGAISETLVWSDAVVEYFLPEEMDCT